MISLAGRGHVRCLSLPLAIKKTKVQAATSSYLLRTKEEKGNDGGRGGDLLTAEKRKGVSNFILHPYYSKFQPLEMHKVIFIMEQ
jgi:hypothetical protein